MSSALDQETQSGRHDKASDDIENIADLLDRIVENDGDGQDVEVRDLMNALDRRSFGPLLLLPAILAVSPVGAIPGMSIITATLIVLITGQALIGREQIWLPNQLLNFSFNRGTLEKGIEKIRPAVRWFDRAVKPRWRFMLEAPFFHITGLICVLLAISFYPLALVPMGVSVPGIAVICFALGWTARDGVIIALGYAVTLTAAVVSFLVWPF